MLDESIRGAVPDGLYKQITLTFNPWSEKTWIRKRFFCDIVGKDSKGDPIYKERDSHVSADGQILAITTTYQCNEWLDENDLQLFEEMKKNRPKRYWVAGLGNWGVAEGLIYENVEEREFDRYQLVKDRPKLKAAFGLDFGYTNDPSALFCSLVDMDTKEIFVFDELYEKGLGNEELYGRIVNMGYGKERIIADSAEPKSIDRLRDLGLYRIRPAKKGADSIVNGISYVQEFKIIVHPRCVNFLTEIGLYQWDEDKFGKRVNKPIDEWNHCLTGDTIVNTVEGDIRISELVGKCGYVKCFDEKSGLPTVGNFHDVRMTRNKAKVFKISLEDGSCINATADHPVLTRNGWKTVCELTCDDEILQVITQKP